MSKKDQDDFLEEVKSRINKKKDKEDDEDDEETKRRKNDERISGNPDDRNCILPIGAWR